MNRRLVRECKPYVIVAYTLTLSLPTLTRQKCAIPNFTSASIPRVFISPAIFSATNYKLLIVTETLFPYTAVHVPLPNSVSTGIYSEVTSPTRYPKVPSSNSAEIDVFLQDTWFKT